MTTHLRIVHDPDLGTIAAVVDDTGNLLSTAADVTATNLAPYSAAVDAFRDELAQQFTRHPNCRSVTRAFLDAWDDEA